MNTEDAIQKYCQLTRHLVASKQGDSTYFWEIERRMLLIMASLSDAEKVRLQEALDHDVISPDGDLRPLPAGETLPTYVPSLVGPR